MQHARESNIVADSVQTNGGAQEMLGLIGNTMKTWVVLFFMV